MFKIEKGEIPATDGRRLNRGREAIYPFAKLEPGDSFLVPHKGRLQKVYEKISCLRSYHQKAIPGRKYSVRKEEAGVRVWRVA
jgi:hypothetical protein